jgi:hypothetical protein
MSLSYTSAAAEAGLARRLWALWVLWVVGRRGDCAQRQGRGNVATMYACGILGRAFHDLGRHHPATGSDARLANQPKIRKHRG